MPPQARPSTKGSDPKARKITDFWGKLHSTESGSSPMANGFARDSSELSLQSFSRQSTSNASFFTASEGTSLQFASASFVKDSTQGSSPAKSNHSPRKYIVVEDDDENIEQQVLPQKTTRKRPREAIHDSPTPARIITADLSKEGYTDLLQRMPGITSSPPRKRQAMGSTKPTQKPETPTNSKHVDSNIQQLTPLSIASSPHTNEDIETDHYSESPNVVESGNSLPPTSLPTPQESNSPSSAFEEQPIVNPSRPEDRTRARIEEIKRKALEEASNTPVKPPPINLDIMQLLEQSSEEDSDPGLPGMSLGAPIRKVVHKRSLSPKNRKASHSPHASLGSEKDKNGVPNMDAIRRNPPRFSERATSIPPVIEKPKPRKGNTMLDKLLKDKQRENKKKSERTVREELCRTVEEDMKELERRLLYGDAPDDGTVAGEVDPSVTELAFGEEKAKQVNEIFAINDQPTIVISPWRPFWDEQLVSHELRMENVYQLPRLQVSEIHPVLDHFKLFAMENKTAELRFLLESGMLSGLPSEIKTPNLALWLFKISCGIETPFELAVAATRSFCDSVLEANQLNMSSSPIGYRDLLRPICQLGPLGSAIGPLLRAENDYESPIPPNPMTREGLLGRFVDVIAHLSKVKKLPSELPNIIFLLLLLELEPSTSTELRHKIYLTVDEIVGSVDKVNLEMTICHFILSHSLEFRLIERVQLLKSLAGGNQVSRRLLRWIALEFLAPGASNVDDNVYVEPPPLDQLIKLVNINAPPHSPFRISPETDYDTLFNFIEILAVVLTDVNTYRKSQSRQLDQIISELEAIHGKIIDVRAAFLDRTRAKDAIQRLRLRVLYQFEQVGRTNRNQTLHSLLKK